MNSGSCLDVFRSRGGGVHSQFPSENYQRWAAEGIARTVELRRRSDIRNAQR